MKQFIIAIDQLCNTLLGGYADETVSARAFRCHTKRTRWLVTMRIVNLIFFWQTQHCMESFQSEQKRRQLPPEYRGEIEHDSKA